MALKELKPDFERVGLAYNAFVVNLTDLDITYFVKVQWKKRIKGEVPYDIKDNSNINLLLKKYSLESHYKEFIFLASIFIADSQINMRDFIEYNNLRPGKYKELRNANKFFQDNRLRDIKIVIKNKTKNLSTAIDNILLIDLLRDAISKEYEKDIVYIEPLKMKEEEDQGVVYMDKELAEVKKGRKRNPNSLGRNIAALQIYLQEFTELKAEEGILISRSQASFIYEFLDLIGIISKDLAWKEDNIRHIYLKYKERLKKKYGFLSNPPEAKLTNKKKISKK
jgi:hypothetical protein